MEKQNRHILRPTIEEMCAGMHYLFAYPYPFSQKQKNTGQHALLTYSNENSTIQELSKQFKKIFPKYIASQHVYFTLSKGYFLQNSWTMAYLKKLLHRENIDGIQIYIEAQDTSSEVFINQHGSLEQKIYNQPQFNSSCQIPFQIKFVLPSKKHHIITINGFYQQKTQQFIHKLFLEIKRQFHIQVGFNSIDGCFIRKNSQRLIQNITIQKNEIMSGEEVEVVFIDSTLRFDINVPLQSLNKLKIYDLDMEIRVLNYDLVKYQTFSNIYKTYFGKDISLNKVYLKIMNIVVSQDETIEKAKQLFQQAAEYTKIVVSGYIISQKMLFDIQIYNSQKVAWKTFDYDDSIQKKIKKFIKQKKIKLSKANLKQDELLLELIYLYTSETIKDGLTIYQSINEYLRNQNMSLKHQKQWKYSFVNNFIKNMHLLKNVKRKTVYRGVNYVPIQKIGEKILFKAFTSTSKDKEIAYHHPIQYSKKRKLRTEKLSLFIMKIEEGKSLSEYSIYEGQEQILIEPYSQFQIQKIAEKQYKYQSNIYPFVIFTLKQVKYNLSPLKDNKSTFILWIDDKLQEGKFLYTKIEQAAGPSINSLVFKQFASTIEFSQWLQTNKKIIKDNSAHVLVISNMKRKQNGKINERAGLHCLNELFQYTYKIPFIFYVRNTKATKSHLKVLSFAQAPIIHVTQYQQDLIGYIKKYTPINIAQQQDSCSVQ